MTLLGLRADASTLYGATIGVSVPAQQNVSLTTALTEKGFSVNSTANSAYAALAEGDYKGGNRLATSFSGVLPGEEPVYSILEPTVAELVAAECGFVSSVTQYNDVGIVVVGRPSSEAADYYPNGVNRWTNAGQYLDTAINCGDYYFTVGNGSHEAVNNVLAAQGYNVDGDAANAKVWSYSPADGLPFIWGFGLNLHRHPYNGRNGEYYSEDSILVGYIGVSMCRGALTKGLICAPKHFAFNDQESNRNGVAAMLSAIKDRVHNTLYVYAQSNMMNSINSSSSKIEVNVSRRLAYKSVYYGAIALTDVSVLGYILTSMADLKKKKEAAYYRGTCHYRRSFPKPGFDPDSKHPPNTHPGGVIF